jgi:hypothetical protein
MALRKPATVYAGRESATGDEVWSISDAHPSP